MKRNKIVVLILILVPVLAFLMIYGTTFKVNGNPIPYLIKASQLNEKSKYVMVKDKPLVYVTKRDEYDDFFDFIEKTYDVTYHEQMGSDYIFIGNPDPNYFVIANMKMYPIKLTLWSIREVTN